MQIAARALRPGDSVFFKEDGKSLSVASIAYDNSARISGWEGTKSPLRITLDGGIELFPIYPATQFTVND